MFKVLYYIQDKIIFYSLNQLIHPVFLPTYLMKIEKAITIIIVFFILEKILIFFIF